MRRREFIRGIGSTAVWPLAAKAESNSPKRRIGLLMGYGEADAESQVRLKILRQALEKEGLKEGKNIQIDLRWANADAGLMERYAQELVALQPDVIVTNTTPVTAAVRRETKSIPVVFVIVADPEGEGFIDSLAHPASNMTGFLNFEGTIGGKWLELLREVAPNVQRVAFMFNPNTAARGGRFFGNAFELTARSVNITSVSMPVRSVSDIESSVAAFAAEPASGLVVSSDSFTTVQRKPIIALAAKYRLPAVYSLALFAADGGLLGYGSDARDQFARSASYVARILYGERPQDLPVQAPIKYELAINLKTAQALGLVVPLTLLARADEVIE